VRRSAAGPASERTIQGLDSEQGAILHARSRLGSRRIEPAPKPPIVVTRNAKLLSLLMILESLRQAPVSLDAQKV